MGAAAYQLKRYRGKWCVYWTEGGRSRRVSLRTADRDEAERRFADWRRDLERLGPTVAEQMEAYLAEKDATAIAASRLRDAWKAARPHFGHLMPDQVDRMVCRSYTALRRRQGRQDGTIKKELETVRAGLRWADRHNRAVFEMPAAPPPRTRYLTRDEYNRLVDAAQGHVRLFIMLAIATAGRQKAILELTWDRVDFDRGLIYLATDGRGKGRATVPMTRTARAALIEAREAKRTDWVIEWADAKVGRINKAVKFAADKAGLEGVSPHVLRHTAAVWMAEAGIPTIEIAQYLGHSDSRITERVYARFSPDYLRGAAAALEA